jgi:hypothetical protein
MDAKGLREAMKSKARRLAGASSTKVDSSDFTPAEPLNAEVKTGMRPISRRAFKSGGKVDGDEAKSNASRTPRGNVGLANTNQRIANEERDGKKHVGGFKKGGRVPKYIGGSAADPVSVEPPTEAPVSKYIAKRKDGGRTVKAGGGSMRPMARPADLEAAQAIHRGNRAAENSDAPAKMGYAPETSIRPKARAMNPEEMKNQEALDRAAKYGQKSGGKVGSDNQPVSTAGSDVGDRQPKKKGGMVEGSAKDMAEDKALAKKRGMSMKEWEGSKADKAHDKGCTCKACGGAAMKKDGGGLYANIHAKRERGAEMRKPGAKGAPSASDFKAAERTARKSGGKVGKTNINIIISPHHDGKLGSMGPQPGMEAGIPKPPMPGPAAPPVGGPPPMPPQLPPGLGAALAGAAGAGPAGPGGPGGMPPRPPMPMMARKSGGKVVYPITGGAGGGRARKEKIDAYGETMNKDLRK